MADQIRLIRGREPDSINEWYVSLAFDYYNIEYRYQVPIMGGRIRGGQILDFVIYHPFEIAVPVFGEYWHLGQLDTVQTFKLNQIQQIFGKNKVIILWGSETVTLEKAKSIVLEKIV